VTSLPPSAAAGAQDVDAAVGMGPHDPDVEDAHRSVEAIVMADAMRHPNSSSSVCFEELWFWTR
jgi:hypothetical protein